MKSTRTILAGAVVVLAVLVTFGRTVHFDFVGGWDDGPLIVDNPMINPPTGEGLTKIWTQPHARMFIPVVYSTWWTLAKLATVPGEAPGTTALNPYVFHATNVIVHAASALIVFAILRLLVRQDWPAAAGAMVFALHPLQVEPVAWATGMKDVLSGILALAATWQYLCFTTTTELRRRRIHYGVATGLFVLALLAKPSSVVVPFILIAIERLLLGRSMKRMALAISPWIALAAAWMVVTAKVQPTPDVPSPPIGVRCVIAGNALGFYVGKLIWPGKLGIDYGLRPAVMARGALFVMAIAAAGLIAMARKQWLTAAGLIFVIALAPTLGLKPFVFQWWSTVADRYAYLALLGPALAVAVVLVEVRKPVVAWAAAIAIAGLGARSFVQAEVWADGRTLMEHALAVNPKSPVAHNHLGYLAYQANDVAAAHAHFTAAVEWSPQFLNARDNLAATLVRQGRIADAIAVIRQTLAIRRALPEPIAQPIDQDLQRLAVLERMLKLPGASSRPAAGQ